MRRDFESGMLWHYPAAGHLLGTMAAPAVIAQFQMPPDTISWEAESQVKVERGHLGEVPLYHPSPSLPPSFLSLQSSFVFLFPIPSSLFPSLSALPLSEFLYIFLVPCYNK